MWAWMCIGRRGSRRPGTAAKSSCQPRRVGVAQGVSLCDLGEHRFKDLTQPERLYQLGDDDFPAAEEACTGRTCPFPRRRSSGSRAGTGGRRRLLTDGERALVTLTGAGWDGEDTTGGAGRGRSRGGVPGRRSRWVPLAHSCGIRPCPADPRAGARGRPEPIGGSRKRWRSMSPVVERLLVCSITPNSYCPRWRDDVARAAGAYRSDGARDQSRATATARANTIYGRARASPMREGVELFVTRAAGAEYRDRSRARRRLRSYARASISLPLALEFAAPRTWLFSPEPAARRAGPAARPAQRRAGRRPAATDPAGDDSNGVIRATRGPAEQGQLLARLSVFVGGCTYEAAEEVCDRRVPTRWNRSSTKACSGDERRRSGRAMWMLETIRAFADEQLHRLGDEDGARERHSRYFATLGDRAYEDWRQGVMDFQARLGLELDNIRVALANTAEHKDGTLRLRLAIALAFASGRSSPAEARGPLENALSGAERTPADLRAQGLAQARVVSVMAERPRGGRERRRRLPQALQRSAG